MSGGNAIAICIPARDEAARLPRLFHALENLIDPPGATVFVCLLLDGCTDASNALADGYRARSRHGVSVVAVERGPSNAGRARDRAMRGGIAAAGNDAILLTTDADSMPSRDWLAAMVAGLGHADLVTGDVVRARHGTMAEQDRIEDYYARLFALRREVDPVAWEAVRTHHHASGANMALRAATYRALGGFAPVERGEDARLVDDAARAGWRVRRDAASVVVTSDRRIGRAQGGLATMLREIDRRGLDGVSVAHPADQLWQYRMQAMARVSFGGSLGPLAVRLGLPIDHLVGVARDCPNAEAFAMRVVPVPPGGMRSVPFVTAEATLTALTATREAAA
ncbi:glycosyltransferase [Sphingomonas sp. 2R-10]|uniref:glycosyltransferase n=1 Tax=Sphingomonas sp. 2R-10 TaxID=3045148 RepID=UPI000F7A2977|nr:glycosyltransferase [Sphingomonas sp. 2R-10]MDJ0275917.1 glycosyltransferase [Sphingomonas sp. 2R-10]